MARDTITRRGFISRAAAAGAAVSELFPTSGQARSGEGFPGEAGNPAPARDESPNSGEKPRITPMLYGLPRKDTNMGAWFKSMRQWGVQQWMSFATGNRPDYGSSGGAHIHGVPFLEDAWPGFRPFMETKALAEQEAMLRKVAALSAENNIEFWYLIPFPLFPSSDRSVVEKVAPYFLKSGQVNLHEPRLAELLKAEIRQFKKALPAIKGINVWLAEGSGSMGSPTAKELEHNAEWERPLIDAFNRVTEELKIGGILFAHEYLLTVRTHRNVYEMMQDFPQLILMDDITWPEEDMLHPFLGYLPQEDHDLLFQTNPVALNFLLDTEYIGEGVLPSVYPRWWKHNISEAVRSGTAVAMGRTFFWDDGLTDVNFNRLNAHMFVRFCYDPDIPARQALGEAAREMFGDRIPERLIDILWETEPVLKKAIGVNGVDSFDHSRFPQPVYLDAVYTPQSNAMKAVDDLFSPAGTKLYPPLTDDLNNYKQWRWQNKAVSEPAEVYLRRKKDAVSWIGRILPEVRQLSAALAPHHREMFVHGYELLASLASGMELFVETAALHHQWAHAKTIEDGAARAKFRDLATRFRTLAAEVPENPFLYKERMLSIAEFLENDLPRIGAVFQSKPRRR